MPSLNFTVRSPIVAVDQGNVDLCWAAATAVLYGWKDSRPYTMAEAAGRLGGPFVLKQVTGSALSYADLGLWQQSGPFGQQHQQCIAASGWDALLRRHGPLITLVDGTGAHEINHAVVVYGIEGDGAPTTTRLKVANGQGGRLQLLSLHDFVTIFEIGPGQDLLFSVMYFK